MGRPNRRQEWPLAGGTSPRYALYWLGRLAAVPFAFCALYAAAVLAGFFDSTANPAETQIFAERMTALAILCWLAGRIARYLLAGT
jgi:hypothetical protein